MSLMKNYCVIPSVHGVGSPQWDLFWFPWCGQKPYSQHSSLARKINLVIGSQSYLMETVLWFCKTTQDQRKPLYSIHIDRLYVSFDIWFNMKMKKKELKGLGDTVSINLKILTRVDSGTILCREVVQKVAFLGI